MTYTAGLTLPARGRLLLTGWAGGTAQVVEIIGQTPTRYRIRSADGEPVRLAGRCRWIGGANTALVPRRAIQLEAGA